MFRLTINTSNAAFRRIEDETLDTASLARYLETIASILRAGMVPPGTIIDANGNTVGTLEIS